MEGKCKFLTGKVRVSILILIIVVIVIVVIKTSMKNTKTYNQTNNNEITNQNNSNMISNEVLEKGINELKHTLDNKTNKIVLIVDGAEISEREIAFIDFQMNNSYVKGDKENKDPIKRAIENHVILQDANKIGKELSQEESETIEKDIKETAKER